MAKIKAVLALPGLPAEVVEIENKYEAVRDAVGGIITTWRGLGIPGTVGYVHDEGLLIGLPWNRCHPETKQYLAGPILIVGTDNEGNDISLTHAQALMAMHGLNSIMDMMDPEPSSLDKLEDLTGQPAISIHFEGEEKP
jgi:hypothetical protein